MTTKIKEVWIKITNVGEIDIAGLHLMGVSSKRGDSEKIGFFGSGNKYAIASLLRNKIPFKIFSGKTKIKITTEQVMFRGQLYEKINIQGEPTSLTTAMGLDWENWFSIRELYCNAVDEGEAEMTISDKVTGKNGYTTIYIQLTEKLKTFFKNINKYILINDKGIETVETAYGKVTVLSPETDEFICYRKGIRIYPENEKHSLYRYNFDAISINESRMYKYEHEIKERIASFLAVTNQKEIIVKYLLNWQTNVFEKDLYWEYTENDKLSQTWYQLLEKKRVYPASIAINTGDYEGKANSYVVPDELAKKISQQWSDIVVIGFKRGKEFIELEPTSEETNKIDTAIKQLNKISYEITAKVILAQTKLDDVVAWYDRDLNHIYLTRKHLGSLNYLKNTLMEEHFHMLGHEDGQREFVTFLIDEIIKSKEQKL